MVIAQATRIRMILPNWSTVSCGQYRYITQYLIPNYRAAFDIVLSTHKNLSDKGISKLCKGIPGCSPQHDAALNLYGRVCRSAFFWNSRVMVKKWSLNMVLNFLRVTRPPPNDRFKAAVKVFSVCASSSE